MSSTEESTQPEFEGIGPDSIDTRQRLWIFLGALVLTFVVVVVVAFL